MFNTATKEIWIENDSVIGMLQKEVSKFIDYKSPLIGELRLKLMIKNKNVGVDIEFANIYIHKIFNDYMNPEYVDHYDIISGSYIINKSIISKIKERNLLNEISDIEYRLTHKLSNLEFLKFYAMNNYTTNRRYLYNDGKFTKSKLPDLTLEKYELLESTSEWASNVLDDMIRKPKMYPALPDDKNLNLDFCKYITSEIYKNFNISELKSLRYVVSNITGLQILFGKLCLNNKSDDCINILEFDQIKVVLRIIDIMKSYMNLHKLNKYIKHKYIITETGPKTIIKKRSA